MSHKMIMDLDTGIDDALALVYALSHDDIEIIGVTTSFGNVTVDYATDNSLNILDMLGFDQIPVYEGASSPWGDKYYITSPHLFHIHGDNGIGNVDLGKPKRTKHEQNAVEFILDSANKYGDELILYTAGPMTNLADAIKKDSMAVQKISKIVSMASALTVPGNVSSFAEANIRRDPKAAKYVLESDIPMTLVGLDVTLKTKIKGIDITSWRPIMSRASQAVVDMATYYYTNEFDNEDIGGAMHDPLAVEVAINPSIVKESINTNLTVDIEGPGIGRTTGNTALLNHSYRSKSICLDVDNTMFINRFVKGVYQVLNNAPSQ